MNAKNTGGTAFPLIENRTDEVVNPGMTLRDYFAGQALQGLISGLPDSDCGIDGFAHDAYMYADAMLEEREK